MQPYNANKHLPNTTTRTRTTGSRTTITITRAVVRRFQEAPTRGEVGGDYNERTKRSRRFHKRVFTLPLPYPASSLCTRLLLLITLQGILGVTAGLFPPRRTLLLPPPSTPPRQLVVLVVVVYVCGSSSGHAKLTNGSNSGHAKLTKPQ